ncbi:putative hydrolase [Gordonia polyisoprenivorans NBRC 16320 = JCM 10675]|uniref:Hydrolase n=1 Tax=Gordonia polyisoprenivorans TaxID=84595 RepID=A0A846WH69_9ACTN|nr:hydrolase [Gordonia polyisoprenivorans]NKY00307.1 hydrolase [Gordonia polyisoprenivorans]OZC33958.1 hydrolase [Gordonia polyisoprenivorans]GAB25966.1 putative hydrolase [Gordonia polyisoprenivorans NBRC 16320 = JCM 10675]
MTRIVCVPLAPDVGRFEQNCVLIEDGIATAVSAGADIAVLPELATSGYVFESGDEARGVALHADADILTRWALMAGDTTVVVGFAEVGGDGSLHNSVAILDGGEVRRVYRKVHLWNTEKRFFIAGSLAPPVLDTRHGRIGVMICYDLEFPELTRKTVLAGADVLLAPVNWPLVQRPVGERPPEQVIAMATARINRVFVACCDRSGAERGQEWTEGTVIVGHEGWPLAGGRGSELVIADVDLREARDKRLAGLADALGDRRPDVYAT